MVIAVKMRMSMKVDEGCPRGGIDNMGLVTEGMRGMRVKWGWAGRRERRVRVVVVKVAVVMEEEEASYMDKVKVRWKDPLAQTRLLVASWYASIFVTI